LRLLGLPEEDWPSHSDANSTCFKENREAVFIAEIGKDDFERLLQDKMTHFSIRKRSHALKNPRVVSAVLKAASALRKVSPSLKQIVDSALGLRR
jgi:hypothetical protein